MIVAIPAVIVARSVTVPILPLVAPLCLIPVLLLISHARISIIIRVGVLVLISIPMGVPLVGVLPIMSVAILTILARILLGVPLLVIGLSWVTLLVPIHFRPVILLLLIMILVWVVLLLLLLVILLHLRAVTRPITRASLICFWL